MSPHRRYGVVCWIAGFNAGAAFLRGLLHGFDWVVACSAGVAIVITCIAVLCLPSHGATGGHAGGERHVRDGGSQARGVMVTPRRHRGRVRTTARARLSCSQTQFTEEV
jgi:hypothetical protein